MRQLREQSAARPDVLTALGSRAGLVPSLIEDDLYLLQNPTAIVGDAVLGKLHLARRRRGGCGEGFGEGLGFYGDFAGGLGFADGIWSLCGGLDRAGNVRSFGGHDNERQVC